MLLFALVLANLSFDQIVSLVGLAAAVLQALVLPATLYMLAVQTRAMRLQTTALIEQSREMTTQTRVFTETIYSATFQSLYDAEAHIGELMMTYPEASHILMRPQPVPLGENNATTHSNESLSTLDPEVRERVRWLGTALLDFFEHIWTQAQMGGLPKNIWSEWEDYMGKILSETYLLSMWQEERNYYSPGFRRFVDLKIGLSPEAPTLPARPRLTTTPPDERRDAETQPPTIARVLRAVAEDPPEKAL